MNQAAALARPDFAPGKWISAVLAFGMHVLLVLLLFYSVRWQTQTPVAVEVELVRAMPAPEPAVPPAPTIEPPAEPEPAPEPPKPVVKAEPVPLPPPPKPEIAVKEKPKKIEPPKPEKAPVKTPPVVEKPDPMKARLAKESQRIQQLQAANEASSELDKVKQAQANAAANAARARDIDKWLSAIRGKIRGNMVLTIDVKGNPEAIFDLTLLVTGEIISVRLEQSSGDPQLDTAIERAIKKSNPLPKPEKPEIFDRKLSLRYRPKDEY